MSFPLGGHRTEWIAPSRRLEAYRRDRRKDQLLQEKGDFVLRFLAEEVEKSLISCWMQSAGLSLPVACAIKAVSGSQAKPLICRMRTLVRE